MDEVRFQQYGSRCRLWVPPEVKDPVLLHHPTRKSVGYFGAVRLRDGKFLFAREAHRFDAMTVWAFLRLLQRRTVLTKAGAAWSSLPIMPNTTTPNFISLGVKRMRHNFSSITCPRTARSSIPSSASGNSPASFALTMSISPIWRPSSPPSKRSSPNGRRAMRPYAVCVPSNHFARFYVLVYKNMFWSRLAHARSAS
jgi:hypothetical protein